MKMQIRKQEDSLTVIDLMQYPSWEYALGEENLQGQNEKTLRPYIVSPPLDRDQAFLIVRATFILANDISFKGFIKPIRKNEKNLSKPYCLMI